MVAARIKSDPAAIDDREVANIKYFMKDLMNSYQDMMLLANGVTDKDKSAQAKEIAKEFRVNIRECDKAATSKDFEVINSMYPKTKQEIADFLDLLRDVPDEL